MKQQCSWCGRDRKAKHFPPGSADCKDCVKQQANQTLAGSPAPTYGMPGTPNPVAGHGAQSLAGLLGSLGSPARVTGPGHFKPPTPAPKPKPKKPKGPKVVHAEEVEEHECPGDETCDICVPLSLNPWKQKPVRSVGEVNTFDQGDGVEKLRLKLKYNMSEDGKPLTPAEREDIERLIERATEPLTPEEEEAAAIESILGGGL